MSSKGSKNFVHIMSSLTHNQQDVLPENSVWSLLIGPCFDPRRLVGPGVQQWCLVGPGVERGRLAVVLQLHRSREEAAPESLKHWLPSSIFTGDLRDLLHLESPQHHQRPLTPGHQLFQLLASVKRFRAIKSKTRRLKKLFLEETVFPYRKTLNTTKPYKP